MTIFSPKPSPATPDHRHEDGHQQTIPTHVHGCTLLCMYVHHKFARAFATAVAEPAASIHPLGIGAEQNGPAPDSILTTIHPSIHSDPVLRIASSTPRPPAHYRPVGREASPPPPHPTPEPHDARSSRLPVNNPRSSQRHGAPCHSDSALPPRGTHPQGTKVPTY